MRPVVGRVVTETRAFFNFNSGYAEKNARGVKEFQKAGSKRVYPVYDVQKLSGSRPKAKPKAKPSTAKKNAAAKSGLFSFGTTKPTVKKPLVKKPLAKKPMAKKPMAKKPMAKKPMVKKPLLSTKPKAKPMMVYNKKPAFKPAVAKTRPVSSSSSRSLEETANLGFIAIIAGSFLLSVAILPGVADVALESIGIAYTLYFTYNYLLFEESRNEFRNTLDQFANGTGIDIPAFFDGVISAVSSVTDKLSEPKSYPKKTVVVPVSTDLVSSDSADDDDKMKKKNKNENKNETN
ncbi:hypothetical protein BE221DRAFT_144088 [Ostreococcus tauri]|uniref:Cyanobacterial aminoacyl-tRNA synthetase CAAD domain-containing protein n=1 Tax=Ostreococcus tauri TaxID=70448 RepID=A0A1Y5IJN6_OSTTA|nr:hypothetical protein BE221DRAFT_144088 [Ostreococcus tauri]